MGYINEDEINKIRNSADIVEIISNYISLTKKGRNYFGVCPFHDDHSPSMSVSPEKQIFRCFTCGESGNVFTFVQKYENVSFLEAINIVASKVGITVTNITGAIKKDNKNQKFYDVMDITSKYYENNLKTKSGETAKKYLIDRGLSETVINDFHIGLSLDTKDTLKKLLISKGYSESMLLDLGLITGEVNDSYDQLKGRIIFPLHNSNGNIIGFTGRIYRGEESAKYVNTKETIIFKKGENLYNYYLAKENVKKEKSVILVEGQMDAIRLYSEGFTNVVATGGTSLTKEQIELLKKLKCKIILCLDNDGPGEVATYKMGEELVKEELEVAVIRLSGAKDPDEYIKKNGKEAFAECLKNLIKFLDFKILYLKNNKDLNNSVDLSKYINNVLEELKKEKDEILRDIILQKLSKDYGVDIEVLKNKLGTVTAPVVKKEVIKKERRRKSKCELACEKILYFMMNNPIYIKIYEKQLGFMPIDTYRVIANEIIYYYDMHKEINMADFITLASNKESIRTSVLDVVSQDENVLITEEEMNLYIKIVKDNIKELEIIKLKEKMKNEMDINKKVEIANKIANLKKGSV